MGIGFVKNKEGNIITDYVKIEVWEMHYDKLLNDWNMKSVASESAKVIGPAKIITLEGKKSPRCNA